MLAALSEEQQKWVPVMTLGSQDLHCVSFELMFELSQNMLLHVCHVCLSRLGFCIKISQMRPYRLARAS